MANQRGQMKRPATPATTFCATLAPSSPPSAMTFLLLAYTSALIAAQSM